MQDLDKFKNEMNLSGKNVYVGYRYVPKIFGEWNNENIYEPLSIVQYQGTSYTSRQYVPVGVEITNEEYWVVTGNYNAQVEQYRQDVRNLETDITSINSEVIDARNGEETLNDRLEIDKQEVNEQLTQTVNDLQSRAINVLYPPSGFEACVGDGVHDDTQALQNLINNFDTLISPSKHTFRVTDTIYLKNRHKTLQGELSASSSNDYKYNYTPMIYYDGDLNRKKSVIVIGQNGVGDIPTVDASGLALKNVVIDGNYKAGFGIYGTFLTNESVVDSVITIHTLEYGQFYAKSWYARFENLTARFNKGKGLSFGIPLSYQNGEEVEWGSLDYEMNNTPIRNLRAHANGEYYSKDNLNIFSIEDSEHREKGYGIGLGIGHAFNVDTYTSESNGGVNLFVYSRHESVKNIRNGYLEKPMVGSGVADSEKTNILIKSTSNYGGPFVMDSILMNENSGGIHVTGEKKKIWLKNVRFPSFLRSLDGLDGLELYSFILKENVSSGAGTYNTLEDLAIHTHYESNLDTNKNFTIKLPRFRYGAHLLYGRLSASNADNKQPISTVGETDLEDGSTNYFQHKTYSKDEWTFIRRVNGNFNRLTRNGGIGEGAANIDLKIITFPPTLNN